MNALIVAVDHTPASRQRATAAAHLAASLNRPLHLVSGVKAPLSGTIAFGSEEFFYDSLCVADAAMAQLREELNEIVPVTCSVLPTTRRAAMRHEAKRLSASRVITRRHLVARVAGHFRSTDCRPTVTVQLGA